MIDLISVSILLINTRLEPFGNKWELSHQKQNKITFGFVDSCETKLSAIIQMKRQRTWLPTFSAIKDVVVQEGTVGNIAFGETCNIIYIAVASYGMHCLLFQNGVN